MDQEPSTARGDGDGGRTTRSPESSFADSILDGERKTVTVLETPEEDATFDELDLSIYRSFARQSLRDS
ncbi:orc1/cdc6 family replication initiation protein [Natronorubrum texcoconense]|uniref:Uncharacterized protein n=1 Tax=Natronorubrum texcoconense TaxID=1095776 RepID=A0A1G8V712_9EURY|nr:orc1/cdc6 family replication initiation protein [Natronorubrum texcoconense]SDJ61125.1 hypothetical protein SAMN04515672_1174 [Natronorubrum texcoconense]